MVGSLEFRILRLLSETDGAEYGASLMRQMGGEPDNKIYTVLHRMRTKGWVVSHTSDPYPRQGGRRREYYTMTPDGHAALRRAQIAFGILREGVNAQ